MQRRNNIDIIRGFAMLLVVLGHEIGILEGKGVVSAPGWHVAFQAIYEVHMPILFGISGYLLQGKAGKDTQFGKAIGRSVLALYVPYLVLTYGYFLERVIANAKGTQLQVPLDTSFGGILRLAWAGNGRLEWFLLSLLLIRVIYLTASKAGMPWLAHAVYIICAILLLWLGDIWVINYTSYGVFFTAGCLTAKYRLEKKLLPTVPVAVACIVLGFIWSGAGLARVDVVSKLLIGSSLTVLLLMLPEIKKRGALAFFGRYSMVLYLVHGLTQNILFTVLVEKCGLHNAATELPVTILLQLALTAAVILLLERVRGFGWIRYIFYPDKLCRK